MDMVTKCGSALTVDGATTGIRTVTDASHVAMPLITAQLVQLSTDVLSVRTDGSQTTWSHHVKSQLSIVRSCLTTIPTMDTSMCALSVNQDTSRTELSAHLV